MAINPNDTGTLSNKGVSLDNSRRYEEVITYYDKLLNIYSNDVDALNNKGVVGDLGHRQEVITYYDSFRVILK